MAQDITARVVGQNPDGSFQVRMDSGNPFGGGGGASQAMVPMNQAAGGTRQYTVMIGNQTVAFASEADMLKAQMALQNLQAGGGSAPQLLGGAQGGTTNWLNVASNAASAINNLFSRSNLDRKLKEYDRAIEQNTRSREALAALQSKYPDLVPVLQDVLLAERRATETAQAALEDLMAANGVAIGVDVTRVASDFLADRNGASPSIFQGGSGTGTLLAAGAGLGVGLLASRSSSDRDRR